MTMESRRRGGGWRVAGGVALASASAAGALALANWLAARGAGDPEPALDGESALYAWTHGTIHYTVKGRGEPLLLVHGIYPGASAYEYRRIFDALARRYRVFALDLLGFGQSGRPAIDYTAALYVELIEDVLRQVVGATDQPARVIASGLSATFAVQAANDRPHLFAGLALIEPEGLPARPQRPVGVGHMARRALLRSPLLGEGLYNLAVSRAALRLRLGATAYSGAYAVSDDILDHYYSAAHQPGARFALADARAGALATPIATTFATLTVPTLLIWGRNDRRNPVAHARAFQALRPDVELRIFPTGSMPQEEAPESFLRALTTWLGARARV